MTSQQPISTIRVVHHLARCGGTLICRCLGSMRDVILLSEVHPKGMKVFDPLTQSRNWFQLTTEQDALALESESPYRFLDAIDLIYRRGGQQNKTLVLRDWTHLDFIGVPFKIPLTYRLTTALQLQHRYRVVQIATVRHPIDQWLSFQKSVSEDLGLDSFLYGYRRFAEIAAEIGFIRYEDFVTDSALQMQRICEQLEMTYDAGFAENWPKYQTITGNTGGSEMTCTAIEQRPRGPISAGFLREFHDNQDYRYVIDLLGYQHD